MKVVIALVMMVALAAPAMADMFDVEITGSVEFSQVNFGQFANVTSGDPVVIRFQLDSTDYLDSSSYPTRGYVMSNFWLTIGGVTVGFQDPYPAGLVPYFVLRDNDPAVDGFFFSHGPDFPSGLFVNEPANVDDYFASNFSVGYTGDTLSSLDIAGAVGVYDYTGLTNFYFSLNDGPFEAMFFEFGQMIISGGGVATQEQSLSQVKSLFR